MPQSQLAGRRRQSKADKAKRTSTSSNVSQPASSAASKSTTRVRSSSHVPNDTSSNNGAGKPTTVNRSTAELPQNNVLSKQHNVFQYLEKEEDENSDSDTSQSNSDEEEEDQGDDHEARVRPSNSSSTSAARNRQEHLPRDLNSDHESSFRESSPDQTTFSITSRASTSTDFEPATPSDGSPAIAHLRLAQHHIVDSKFRVAEGYEPGTESFMGSQIHPADYRYDYDPEAYYMPPGSHSLLYDRPLLQGPTESSGTLMPTEKRKIKKAAQSSGPSSGYAHLASKLDSSAKDNTKLAPLYRRFEAVNHRILLYLQDEIAQMEEELRALDEYEEKHRMTVAHRDGTKLAPASRRMDAEARQYNSFHSRRMELLDRLAYRTNQYNEALCSYSKVFQILPQASAKDIESYRAWMQKYAPIAKSEAGFLDHNFDLVLLRPNRLQGDNNVLYFIIGVMSAALLLPLLAY